MNDTYNYLFYYLEKENIQIDKTEFLFQIQSHPDYPSLLSISDTLNFFNIATFVAKIGFENSNDFPNRFVARLFTALSEPQFYLIEKKGEHFFYTNDHKLTEISKSELEKRWTEIVLLLEKPENEKIINPTQNKWFWVIPLLSVLLFLGNLIQFQASWQASFFFLFPIVGVLFSVAALKDLFGAKSELLNSFCNMTASTSCSTIVGSSKWKIFEIVNFSDLSIVFFTSQFLSLLAFLFMGDTTSYFGIQQLLLVGAIPVLFASVYYQKFVEKKWCPICLVIIGIILLELGYVLFLLPTSFDFSMQGLLVFGLVFVVIALVWSVLKKVLLQQKELKEFQFKGNRFMRNYEVFKNTLTASDKTNYQPLSSGNLIVGNKNANLKITLVSNPYCGHCASAHTIIEQILKKHRDTVCVDFRFNFNREHYDEQFLKVHQKLVRIYHDNEQDAFIEALQDWFENKDENRLLVSEITTISDLKIAEILQEQYLMNQANDITFTPSIIINKYPFPKVYDRTELPHFINDLVEDTLE